MAGNSNPESDWRVWQNPEVATNFANEGRAAVMGAEEQMNVLRQLLPEDDVPSENRRVLDLGCGDGVLLATVLSHWQGAEGIALDGSPAMIELAHTRFANTPNVQYVSADFNDSSWRDALPSPTFDAVISGYAIHHSEDDRKRALYSEILQILRPGGVFVNIEHVASASPKGESLFEHAYAYNLTRIRQKAGADTDFERTLEDLHQRLDKSANRLTPVETQLQWLREIGFQDVDCYWKHYELAILAGYRP